jgi:hypothetical protein
MTLNPFENDAIEEETTRRFLCCLHNLSVRKECGEDVTKESWVMRTLWDTAVRKAQRGATGDLRNLVNPVHILTQLGTWERSM